MSDEPRDPNQPPEKPVKRRGRPKGSKNRKDTPPRIGTLHALFPDNEAHETTSHVEIPAGGVPGSPDPRKRTVVKTEVELGKRWSEIYNAVAAGEYSWDEFVQSLTPAELARGQLMDKEGTFRGRPPKMVPRQFLNACTKELLKRGATLWKENYVDAINAMTSIAKDGTQKASDRLRAAEFVIERLEGKVPQVVAITSEDPWQVALDGVIAETSEDMAIARAHSYQARVDAQAAILEED